jgi:DNA gyrase/topoisomerase IV subunit B
MAHRRDDGIYVLVKEVLDNCIDERHDGIWKNGGDKTN